MFVSRADRSGRVAVRRAAVAGLFLAFAFVAGAARAADNSAFVSYGGVPMTMEPKDEAWVTVTMSNTGTTTWGTTLVRETTQGTQTTTRTSFRLGAVGHDWGVGNVAVSGSVAPGARRSFRFRITAPATKGTYVFQWKMARDTIVIERPTVPASPDWGFGAVTPRKLIVVKKKPVDTRPEFEGDVPDQVWQVGKAIKAVQLPEATGGNGKLWYSLSGCRLPEGVKHNAASKKITGTPLTATTARGVTCTWKVTDSDANTAESDTDKRTFKVTVLGPPVFDGGVPDQVWQVDQKITPVVRPRASGGRAPLSYTFTDACLPDGVTEADGTISGRPTEEWTERTCTWTVTDSDDNTAASDTDKRTFTVKVAPKPEEDTAPEFEGGVDGRSRRSFGRRRAAVRRRCRTRLRRIVFPMA